MNGLKAFIETTTTANFELAHLQDFYQKGIKDKDFIPRLSKEGWIVVSADRGRRKKDPGDVLPRLCKDHKMTHILLGKTIHGKKQAKKLIALETVWEDIVRKVVPSERGSRWILRAGPLPHHHPYLEFRPYDEQRGKKQSKRKRK